MEPNVNHLDTDTGSMSMEIQQKLLQHSNGVTSCMGDSGGPLTTEEDGEQKLLGNVSWGHGKCVTDGYPAAYSRNQEPTVNAWIKTNAGL